MNLARWIRRRPVPHALMCDSTRILIGEGHRRWADAVDAVIASSSEAVSAVAKDGTVLRVCQRADIDDMGQDPVDPAVTDTQRELAQVAQIIADAYSMAHEQARETGAKGYEILARITEMSYQRLAAIETAYAKLLTAHAALLQSDAQQGGGDDALGSLVSAFTGGKAAATKTNGAPEKG